MKGFIVYVSLLILILPILFPFLVSAQGIPLPPDVGLPGGRYDNATDIIRNIIQNILLPIAGIVAVLFIIVGGFQYITSGANEEWAETGKKTLRNAVIGLVVIILSYIIVIVIANSLT